MKRATFLLATLLLMCCICGCSSKNNAPATPTANPDDANLALDSSDCTDMNDLLRHNEAYNDSMPSNVEQLIVVLESAGFGTSARKPRTENALFVWDAGLNRILLVNSTDDSVLFPEEYMSKYRGVDVLKWFNIESGEIYKADAM